MLRGLLLAVVVLVGLPLLRPTDASPISTLAGALGPRFGPRVYHPKPTTRPKSP